MKEMEPGSRARCIECFGAISKKMLALTGICEECMDDLDDEEFMHRFDDEADDEAEALAAIAAIPFGEKMTKLLPMVRDMRWQQYIDGLKEVQGLLTEELEASQKKDHGFFNHVDKIIDALREAAKGADEAWSMRNLIDGDYDDLLLDEQYKQDQTSPTS